MLIQKEWWRLLRLFNIDENIINKTFGEIVAAYENEGRYYHNLKHIQEMLQIVESFSSQYKLDASLYFAVWFHDIIYDTHARDNEEKSAEYARELLSLLNIPSTTIENTCRLILATKHHQVASEDIEGQILIDADLAILGSNSKRYKEYMEHIRREYAWVCDCEYNAARGRVLQKFLERARIFSTTELYNELEEAARENIKGEILGNGYNGCNG